MDGIPRHFSTERVQAAKDRVTELYHQQNTDRPCYRVYDYPPEGVLSPVEQAIYDPDRSLQWALNWFERCSHYEGDFIPSVGPVDFVIGIPSAFGCEIVQPQGAHPWVKPLITDCSEIYRLKKPKATDGLLGKALEATRCLVDKTGDSYPIRMVNIQGPLTNAGYLLGDSELLLALYDHPKEMHTLLDMITDVMIEFVHAQRALVGEFNPIVHCPDWIPDGYGIGIPDDYAGVLSPALYEEFALPYNNRLSHEFGGIGIHSCGHSEGVWDVFLKHENLRVVNFELTDNSFEKAVELFSGKAVIAPHAPMRQKKYPRMMDMVRHVVAAKKENTALIITLERHARATDDPFREEEDGFEEAYDFLRGRV
ncbi:MAG: uroporphyrinogen decarboxylase family protein [Candidatus Latescibacterota bacterium]